MAEKLPKTTPNQRTKTPLTPEEKERRRQIKNLRERERYHAKKSGLAPIKTDVSTLSTEEIQALRGESLTSILQFVDPYTGEIVETPSPYDSLNISIIGRITELLSTFDTNKLTHNWKSYIAHKEKLYEFLKSKWDDTLEAEGEFEVAYRLEKSAELFYSLTEKLLYASSSTQNETVDISAWTSLLFGGPISDIESMEISEQLEAAGLTHLAIYF